MTTHLSEFTDKHLSIFAKLLNEEYENSDEFIPFNKERVLSQIRRRDLKILVAEEKNRIIGLVGTHLEEHEEVSIHWFAVSPEHHQKAIENVLVNEVEKYAEGDTVSTMVDEGSPRIDDWINRGYTLEPGFQRMSAKLEELKPVPKIPEEIKLRSLRSDEEEKFVAAVNAGFGWKRLQLGSIEMWKSEDPPFSQDWVQVADIDDKIVSAVVARPDTDHIRYLHLKRGYLGPAATLPEFRNKHLGSALTARAMNFLFEKGMNSVRLGTSEKNVSSIALLRSLGFQVDNVRKIMRKKLEKSVSETVFRREC